MKSKFKKLQAACDKADAALRKAINKEFPKGARVRTRQGRGWMHGVVAFERSTGTDVAIISDAEEFNRSIGRGSRRRGVHSRGYQYVYHE